MFILNSKYILLDLKCNKKEENEVNVIINDIDKFDNINLNESSNRSTDVSDKFDIKESLQGCVSVNIVDKDIYSKSKDYNDYKNYISEIPVFIKSNPLIDVVNYMENKYEFDNGIPSSFSNFTNNKVNSINNNAYIEVLCCYYLNLLYLKKITTLFPLYFGSFNGLAKNYVHDISEDYPLIKDCDWFEMKNDKLGYEVLRNNNLDEFDELSLDDIKLVDYEEEQNIKNIKNSDLNKLVNSDIDLELNLDNIYKNEKRINEQNRKQALQMKSINNFINSVEEKNVGESWKIK